MNITITDTLLLAAVLGLLMLGYVNRRVATARATRGLIKDRLKGSHHYKQDKTMLVLRDRLSLQTSMLVFAAFGTIFAFAAAVCIVYGSDFASKVAFILGNVGGIISLVQALRESLIANQSHFAELDDTVSKDDPYYNTPSA